MALLDDKVRAFLEERHLAVLATINPSGMPQQTAIWYLLEGDEIVLNTRRGRLKDNNLLRDPRLSLCVLGDYHYATLTGTATLIDDQQIAQADIHRLAIRYNGEQRANEQAERVFSKQERVTIRVRIERVHTNLDESR